MSFKTQVIFNFDDGENVEFNTLPDGFDINYIENLKSVKKTNGTVTFGDGKNEIHKKANRLMSIEIIL